MGVVIRIENLIVERQKKRVLDGLSFEVKKGEIFGFLGPNGAGKTTTIKTLLGLVFPKTGTIRLNGYSPTDKRARQTVGFLPEETTYYRYLTPVEILCFYGELFGMSAAERRKRAVELLELVGLEKVAKKPLNTFSKGMTQKVGLAQSLINDPETLILDEPTSGLDPLARMDLRKILEDLKSRGKTIFFSSHELSEVETVCDTSLIIHAGRSVRCGPLKSILEESGTRSLEQFFMETIRGARA